MKQTKWVLLTSLFPIPIEDDIIGTMVRYKKVKASLTEIDLDKGIVYANTLAKSGYKEVQFPLYETKIVKYPNE